MRKANDKFGNQSLIANEDTTTAIAPHIQHSQNDLDDWENYSSISRDDIDTASESNLLFHSDSEQSEESCSENDSENKSDTDISSRERKLVLEIGLEVDGELSKFLLPHQRDGIMFMWRICFGSILKTNMGYASGCILSHCMGLGKYRIILI